jgi:hemerythrin-like domain-containing protein
MMDILGMIRKDHDKFLGIFEDLEKTKASAREREQPFAELKKEMTQHMDAEENIFYPALEKKERDDILEAIEEHNVTRTVSEDVDSTPMDSERWKAKLKVLKELTEHHIEEEEDRIFNVARQGLSKGQLEDMGKRFEEAKGMTYR